MSDNGLNKLLVGQGVDLSREAMQKIAAQNIFAAKALAVPVEQRLNNMYQPTPTTTQYLSKTAEDLAFDEDAQMPDVDDDPLQWAIYGQKKQRKQEALTKQALFRYQAMKHPDQAAGELEAIARTGQPFGLTPENIQAITLDRASKLYEHTVDQFGALPHEIMADPMFIAIADEQTYAFAKTVYDAGMQRRHGGFFGRLGYAWTAANDLRELDLAKARGELTPEEASEREYALQLDLQAVAGDEEPTASMQLAIMFHDMFSAVVNNPKTFLTTVASSTAWEAVMGAGVGALAGSAVPVAGTAAGAAGGALAGAARGFFKGIGLGIAASSAYDTYERELGSMSYDAMRKNGELSIQEAQDKVRSYAVIAASFDLFSDVVFGKVLGSGTQALVNRLAKNTAERSGTAAAEKLQQTITMRVRDNLQIAAKDFMKLQFSELSSEGAQGVVEELGVNAAAGVETTPSDSIHTFFDNVRSAMGATALLGAIGATPRALSLLHSSSTAFSSIDAAKKGIEHAAIVESLIETNPQFAELASRIYTGKFRIKAQDLADYLKESDLQVSDLPPQFVSLMNDLASDAEFEYNFGIVDYVHIMQTEAGKKILNLFKAENQELTMKQAAENLADLGGLKDLQEKIEHDTQVLGDIRRQREEIRTKVIDALVQQGITDAPRADAMAALVANMYESLSNDTGLSIKELHDTFGLDIEQYVPTLDLNVKHDAMHPETTKQTGIMTLGIFQRIDNIRKVIFNRGAPLSTVVHEFAHAYLQMLADVDAKLNSGTELKAPHVRERLEALSKAMGMPDLFTRLTQGEQDKFHERFTALFIQHFLKAGNKPDAPLIGQFKKWLMKSVRSLHMGRYEELKAQQAEQKKRIKDWQAHHPEEMKAWRKEKKTNPDAVEPTGLPEGEERLTDEVIHSKLVAEETSAEIGDTVPEYNSEFADFMNAILMVNDLSADMAGLYEGTDGVLSAMMGMDVETGTATTEAKTARGTDQAKPQLTAEERKAIEAMRQEWLQAQYDAQSELDKFALFYARGIFDTSKSMAEIQRKLHDLAKEGDAEWKNFVAGYERRLLELRKAKENNIRKSMSKPEVKALSGLTFNRDEMRTLFADRPDVYERLEQQGRLADDGMKLSDLRGEYLRKTISRQQAASLIEVSSLRSEEDIAKAADMRATEAAQQEVLKDRLYSAEAMRKAAELKAKLGVRAFNILQRMLGRQTVTDKQLEHMAALAVSKMNYGDIDLPAWTRLVHEYEKEARRAMLSHDLQKAALYLQKAAAMSKRISVAQQMKASIDKRALKMLAAYRSRSPSTIKRYDQNTMTYGRVLLSRLGLMDGRAAKQELDIIRRLNPMEDANYSFLLDDPRFAHSYNNTSMGDLISAMETLGRIKQNADLTAKLHNIERTVTTKTAGDSIVDRIKQHLGKSPDVAEHIADKRTVIIDGKEVRSTQSDLPVFRKIYNTWRYSIDKVLPLCQEIDKATDGACTKYIYRPVRAAFTAYKKITRQFAERVNEIYKEFDTTLPNGMNGWIYADEELGFSFGTRGKFKRNGKLELLGFMMHIGNEYNFNAIAEWVANSTNVDINLPKEARIEAGRQKITRFIERMMNEGVMDKNFFDTLQKLWDINAEAKDYAQQGHYEVTGQHFVEQQNREIRTPWGTYKGGYAPLKRSKDFDYSSREGSGINEFEAEVLNSLPKVNNSFTIERTGKTGYPVDINIEHIMRQVDDVVRYGVMQPVINQVNNLLTNDAYGVNKAFNATRMPDVVDKVFKPWLQRMCTGKPTTKLTNINWINQALSRMRMLTSAAAMCMNINNTIQGLTNILPALSRVNSNYLLQAVPCLLQPNATRSFIMGKSAFMNERLAKQQMDFRNAANGIFVPAAKLHSVAKAKGMWQAMQDWGVENSYFLQKHLQNGLDMVVWSGKYQQTMAQLRKKGGMTEGQMELEAVRQADEAIIATQGSFDIIDSSNVESSNPLVQLFVQFGNYFFTMADLMFANLSIANNPNDPRPLVWARQASAVALTIIAPSIIADMINRTFTRGWDDDEEDDNALVSPIVDSLALSPLRMMAGAIPVVGQLVNTGINQWVLNKNYYTDSFFNLPVVTMTQTGVQGVERVIKGAAGEDVNWYRTWRDAGQFFALVMGFPPAAFAAKWASYMGNWYAGNIRPTSGGDAFLGAVTGKPSTEALVK